MVEKEGGGGGGGQKANGRSKLRGTLKELQMREGKAVRRLKALAVEERQASLRVAKVKSDGDAAATALAEAGQELTAVKSAWAAARREVEAEAAVLADQRGDAVHQLWKLQMDCVEAFDELVARGESAHALASTVGYTSFARVENGAAP